MPVAHNDREPEGVELLVFSSAPASQLDEHWVGIDLVQARSVYRRAIDVFRVFGELPILP